MIVLQEESFIPVNASEIGGMSPMFPPLGSERVANEAACLQFIQEKIDIPVPNLFEAYNDKGAFILVARRLCGVGR
jgi:hypothetical protein